MSFGEELKRERELRQISLREISEATKISLRHLKALERNEFDGLPGGVFNRGFVRAYAQFIGVDPETMVNAYLLQERSQGDEGEQGDSPLRRGRATDATGGSQRAKPDRGRLLRWGLWILIILAVAAGIYFAIRFLAPADAAASAGSETRMAQIEIHDHAEGRRP